MTDTPQPPAPPKRPRPPHTAAGREAAKARQVWCAYDGSDYVLFGAELAALRYAAEHRMACKAVLYGVPLSQQIQGAHDD